MAFLVFEENGVSFTSNGLITDGDNIYVGKSALEWIEEHAFSVENKEKINSFIELKQNKEFYSEAIITEKENKLKIIFKN